MKLPRPRWFRPAIAPPLDDVDATTLEAARAWYVDLARQETRADGKASQVVSQSAILATLAVASIGGLVVLAQQLSPRVLLAIPFLLLALLPWGAGMIIVLRRVIRPQLGDNAFTGAEHLADERAFYLRKIAELRPIVRRRYSAVAVATDLQVLGIIAVALAGLVLAVVLALLAVDKFL